ncbi:MAG TPA: NAD(P)/FAD-dependent oxidoreductase [Gaiellaceae bacterium]|nr:NAD(P)/FAD-dependent oxidoreductase [Gaiellaceae bacterium]
MERYDLIVLGAGSAARDGAKKAATQYGAKVALVESTRWGGSCPNVACKPTKAYLVVAELVHDVNTIAETLGIEVGPARIDLTRVKARKDSLKKPQPKWVEDLNALGFDTYEGEATIVDANTVRVGDEELSADRILIATGSRTAVPPIEGIEDVGWIDHVSALELTELPDSMLVVGGGAVGLEFGQAFARFGSRVTIVDALDQIAPRSDRQAAGELQAALEAEGIEVVLGSFVKSVEREGEEIVATLVPREGEGLREVRATQVLLASGRVPNVEALGLEELGIEGHRLGITVDEHMRTSVEGIWAAGDVTGLAQFTPVAQYQARLAVDDMFGSNGATADYSILPTAIFSDPELAGVGLTEEDAREQGIEYESVVHELKYVQRASYTNTKHGLFKLVFERGSRRVVGLHVVARGAGDIVQGFSLALKLGVTIDDFAGMHHTFPTIGEGVKAAAEQAMPEKVAMAEVRA